MKNLSRVMMVLLMFVFAVSACGPADDPEVTAPTPTDAEPAEGGTVTMGLEGDPERFVTTI